MQQQTEAILQCLIRENIRRKERNLSAEKCVNHQEVKTFFKHSAEQSDGFVMELDIVLRTYGGNIGNAAVVHSDEDAYEFAPCDSDQSVLINWCNWEDKLLNTYQEILDNSRILDNLLFEKIRSQKYALNEGKNKIIALQAKMDS